MSIAQYSPSPPLETLPAEPQDGPLPRGTLLVWVDRTYRMDRAGRLGPSAALHGSATRAQPALVLTHPPAGLAVARIDLAPLGYAHRVTAVDFTPGPGCSSVTLREALDTAPASKVAELLVTGPGIIDLYTVGWAARAAEVVFNA